MKHQTKTKSRTNPSHGPKESGRRALRKAATKGPSIKRSNGNGGSQFSPPAGEQVTRMAAETVLDQSAVVNLAQRSPPEKTVGLDETYRATREVVQSMTGLPQPSNNLVFGFGAIAMEGFEFVMRCVE